MILFTAFSPFYYICLLCTFLSSYIPSVSIFLWSSVAFCLSPLSVSFSLSLCPQSYLIYSIVEYILYIFLRSESESLLLGNLSTKPQFFRRWSRLDEKQGGGGGGAGSVGCGPRHQLTNLNMAKWTDDRL